MDTNITNTNFIGARIRTARENKRITRKDLAEIMCLSGTIVGKWERGNSNPSTAHLIKLAEVLKVSFDWLATGKEKVADAESIVDETTQNIQISQIVKKLNPAQKTKLLGFLETIVY
jgi:transcriptional regulator with XRE-family HTH domain